MNTYKVRTGTTILTIEADGFGFAVTSREGISVCHDAVEFRQRDEVVALIPASNVESIVRWNAAPADVSPAETS